VRRIGASVPEMDAEHSRLGVGLLETEMKATSGGGIVSTATRLAAVAAVVFFLVTAFRSGWRRAETDFPNYYTAAVLMSNGMPVREYYDWTWFQRQMNFAGIERQLGGYQPQTPLTALPLIGLANLPVQTAKRVWLALNFFFLGGTVWMLARITGFRVEQMILLAFLGFGSLYSNFLYGQYYVFLLFLLTVAFYCSGPRQIWDERVCFGSGIWAEALRRAAAFIFLDSEKLEGGCGVWCGRCLRCCGGGSNVWVARLSLLRQPDSTASVGRRDHRPV